MIPLSQRLESWWLVDRPSENDWFDYKLEHDPRFLKRVLEFVDSVWNSGLSPAGKLPSDRRSEPDLLNSVTVLQLPVVDRILRIE